MPTPPFAMIPHAVLDSGLDPYALTVYAFLAKHSRLDAHGARTCYPSLRTLSVESGMALSTVRKSIKVLKSGGFVTIKERFSIQAGRRDQDSHLFTLKTPDSGANPSFETVDPPSPSGGPSPVKQTTPLRQTVDPPPSDTPELEVFNSIKRKAREREEPRPLFDKADTGNRLEDVCVRLFESTSRFDVRPSPFSGKDRRALSKLLGDYSDEELARAYLEHLENLDAWQTRNANASFVDGGAETLIRANRKASLKREQEAQAVAAKVEEMQRDTEVDLARLRAANAQEAADVEAVLGA